MTCLLRKMTRLLRKGFLMVMAAVTCMLVMFHAGEKKIPAPKMETVQQKVILLTYMRSGSSLTGDILQQHQDVFYVFEPLWLTEKYFYGHRPHSTYQLIDNSTLSIPRSHEELTQRYNQVLGSFLNCRLEDIDVTTLTQVFMKFSHSTKDFLTCAQNNKNLTRIGLCLKPLITSCQKAPVVVLKVIRSRIQDVSSILRADPKVKIIHLTRDPRGTLTSQRIAGVFNWQQISKATKEFCQRIESDIAVSKEISNSYQNRILTIRYEDLANVPVKTTRKMYTFLNVDISSDIEKYVWNITYGGHPDGCKMCTNRRNAMATANRWRRFLPLTIVHDIQQECKNVFEFMGYRSFNLTKELRNLKVPAQFSLSSEGYHK